MRARIEPQALQALLEQAPALVQKFASLVSPSEAESILAFARLLEGATTEQIFGWFVVHEILDETFHRSTPMQLLAKIFGAKG